MLYTVWTNTICNNNKNKIIVETLSCHKILEKNYVCEDSNIISPMNPKFPLYTLNGHRIFTIGITFCKGQIVSSWDYPEEGLWWKNPVFLE